MAQQFVYLASASARRAELLAQVGVRFVVMPAHIDETPAPAEQPVDYVVRMAVSKAAAVAMHCQDAPVLGADTSVIVDDRILGKPRDEDDALAMLRALSGREHTVLTAVAVHAQGVERHAVSRSQVALRPLVDGEMRAYWRSGEPCDKAGGYAIQGRGGMFVDYLAGSYSGVVGLPLAETTRLLADAGIELWPERY